LNGIEKTAAEKYPLRHLNSGPFLT